MKNFGHHRHKPHDGGLGPINPCGGRPTDSNHQTGTILIKWSNGDKNRLLSHTIANAAADEILDVVQQEEGHSRRAGTQIDEVSDTTAPLGVVRTQAAAIFRSWWPYLPPLTALTYRLQKRIIWKQRVQIASVPLGRGWLTLTPRLAHALK